MSRKTIFPSVPKRCWPAILLLVSVVDLSHGEPASDRPPAVEQRLMRSLDGVWKFCPAFEELQFNHAFLQDGLATKRTYAAAEQDEYYGWIEPDFNDEAWWDISVPSSWNQAFPDMWSYEGFGWYRKTIEIPESWRGKRVVFVSDGANYRTVLFVNGEKVGVHEGGYVAFSFPIHEQLRFGESNTIAVVVDNLSLIDRCPTERHDWWNHGGLYRSVRLEVTDRVFVDDAVVVTSATSNPPSVRVSAQIRSEDDAGQEFRLTAQLTGSDGVLSASVFETFSLKDRRARVELVLPVENALLWSPHQPNLYDLRLDICEEETGRGRDSWSCRVGIRSIEVDGARLLVNGDPFIVQGINRYENYADTGMTPNDSALRRDIHLLKQMGANAVRCHYPNSPGTYDLYDEAGLFSVCEVPLYQWGRPGHSRKNLEAAKVQLEEMVRSLRNHPSVLMWSVSNETRTRPREEGEEHKKLSEMVVAGNLELLEMAHSLDPTRPAIEPSNRWPDDPVFEKTGVLAPNVYIGARTPHIESLPMMMDSMHERMNSLREMHPGKPILVSEFGQWSLRGFMTDYFPGEGYQAELLRQYWEAFLKEPNFIGGFIWCFADSDVHRKYTRIYEMRCAYGLYDIQRSPKQSARVMRELWRRNDEE